MIKDFYLNISTAGIIGLTIGGGVILLILGYIWYKIAQRYQADKKAKAINYKEQEDLMNFDHLLQKDDKIRTLKIAKIDNFINDKRELLLQGETDQDIINSILNDLDKERLDMLKRYKLSNTTTE